MADNRARVDLIVTWDQYLLKLKQFHSIQIASLREFLDTGIGLQTEPQAERVVWW